MVDFILDEQKISSSSVFLKIQDGSKIRLKSNLVRIYTFYDEKTKKSILWEKEIKEKPRQEFFYFGEIDGQEGVIKLPMSVFIAMNDTERLIGKSKRNFEWIIGKKGEGLQTRYSVVKGDNIEITDEEIQKNNERLKKILIPYEKKLKERLEEYKKLNKISEELGENLENVNPEDIPF